MNFIQSFLNNYNVLRRKGINSFIKNMRYHFVYKRNFDLSYERYKQTNALLDSHIIEIKSQIKKFKKSPKISIITPVFNVDARWLDKAINSVINQIYENWEFCIVDDASTKKNIKQIISKYHEKDERIIVKYLEENQGISGSSNEALSISTGDFVGFLDHDDELSVDALYEVARMLQEHPDADMIYSDEDHINSGGKLIEPYFKPDWSPDLILSSMYTCHFSVYRKKLIDEIGGFRKGYEGSQDYDLVLRLTERTSRIYHIPKILYHWRKTPHSTAMNYKAKGFADINARKALEDALKRRTIKGIVLPGLYPGTFRVKRNVSYPRISIIIPTKDEIDLLRRCINSIEQKTNYKNYEIIIIDNDSKDRRTKEYLEKVSEKYNIKVLKFEKLFNFSAINNFAFKLSKSEYIVFQNNDTEVISEEWLTAMLEHAQRKEVGAVGCKLLYPDDSIQHAGLILGISGIAGQKGIAGHSHKHFPDSAYGYFNRPHIIHDASAVTGACFMLRREIFEEVGGFDENLAVAFNDVDLCLKIRERGFLIVYTPYAKLYHLESASRGYEDKNRNMERFLREYDYMRRKWGNVIDKGDPYYNPNLTLTREDFTIRID